MLNFDMWNWKLQSKNINYCLQNSILTCPQSNLLTSLTFTLYCCIAFRWFTGPCARSPVCTVGGLCNVMILVLVDKARQGLEKWPGHKPTQLVVESKNSHAECHGGGGCLYVNTQRTNVVCTHNSLLFLSGRETKDLINKIKLVREIYEYKWMALVNWSINILYKVLQVVVDILIFDTLLWWKGPFKRQQKAFSLSCHRIHMCPYNIVSILSFCLRKWHDKTFVLYWIMSFQFHIPDSSLLCDRCVGKFR